MAATNHLGGVAIGVAEWRTTVIVNHNECFNLSALKHLFERTYFVL